MRSLEKSYVDQGRTLGQFARDFDTEGQKRMDQLDAGAVLGQVNIAYWKKERVSEQIQALIEKREAELKGLDPEDQVRVLNGTAPEDSAKTLPKETLPVLVGGVTHTERTAQ
jgi:hypothetical protein